MVNYLFVQTSVYLSRSTLKKTVCNNNKKVVKHIISLLTFDRYISFNFTVVMFLDLYDRFIVIVL